MGRRKTHDSGKSLKTLILFCVVVFFVIAVSLTYKAVSLFKSSLYDGKHLFVIAFINEKKLDVVGFFPEEKKMTHLSLSPGSDLEKGKKDLGILFDGTVTLKKDFEKPKDAAGFLQDAAFMQRNATSRFSIIDLLRLSFFSRKLADGNIVTDEIQLPQDDVLIDEKVQSLFTEEELVKENSTIEIVNGTGIPGLGQRVERLLLNRGATIISVTNADTIEKTSRLEYSGEETYTVKKMSRTLNVSPTLTQREGIADILLIIGTDRADQF